MADGVDHIDIYADVGEEFNQVGEGLGLGSAADADGAAAWTLIGVTAGREPGSAADREPGASGPRRCVCGVPLTPCSRASFLRAVERGAGPLCSRRRPPARSSLPQGGLTSHCWLRWRALPAELGRVCGAGRTGPPRPLPRRPPDGGGGRSPAGRARARPPPPPSRPCCSGSDSSRRSILCLLVRARSPSWKAAFTAFCIPRAGSPGLPCSRWRQVSVWCPGSRSPARRARWLRSATSHLTFALSSF